MVFAALAAAVAVGMAAPNAPRLVMQFGESLYFGKRYAAVELIPGGRLARVTRRDGVERHFDLATRKDAPAPAEAKLVGPGGKEKRFQLVGPAGEVIQTFTEPGTYLGRDGWTLSPDGRYLLTGKNGGAIIWRVADGARVASVKDISSYYPKLFRGDEFLWVGPEPDGRGYKPMHLARIDLTTGKELPRIELGVKQCAGGFVLAEGGRVLLTPTETGILRVDLDAKKVLPPIPLDCRPFDPVALSPDGKRLAVVRGREGDLVVLDYPGGTQRLRVPLKLARDSGVSALGFSAGGDRLDLGLTNPARLIVLDAATGAQLSRDDFEPPTAIAAEPLAFAGAVGRSGVVTVAYSGRVRRIDLAGGPEKRGELPPGRPGRAKILPGGSVLGVMTQTADEV